tara:strand:- start:333 stop:857 length:525 start_codon:yes stop_codon:yes gene_type:complete
MDILHYTIDIKNLLKVQDQQTEINDLAKEQRTNNGIANKKLLLKYVLPFMHGLYAIHNNKCTKTCDSSSGSRGLLGLDKEDIEKNLDYIVNTDSHHTWEDNFSVFKYRFIGSSREIKIWLNRSVCGKSKYTHTPKLEYSMTGFDYRFGACPYGDSVEEVLNDIARYCARYTDEW